MSLLSTNLRISKATLINILPPATTFTSNRIPSFYSSNLTILTSIKGKYVV
jgi:hypothetical protein